MDKQIEEIYSVYQKNLRVCIDSRTVEQESIFFALKGPNFDGNKYAQNALDQGASFAIIDNDEYFVKGRSIVVENVLTTLQELSIYHRSKLKIPIIGITGSNGKTTSKELIKCVLATSYKVSATAGNYNNTIGVPLSLLKIGEEHDIGIIEMGSNGKGEIDFLCGLAQPDIGLITSIGKAHLEGFGDIAGVIEEKTALYRSVATKSGKLIYNSKSPYLKDHLPRNTQNIAYSKQGSLTFEIDIESAFPVIKGQCKRGVDVVDLKSKMYGEYNISNIVSALVIGEIFDVDLRKGVTAINKYNPSNNRSEVRVYKGANIFLDAYNANPSSVALVVDQFAKSSGKKILVLGDMLEVGKAEDLEHKVILEAVDLNRFDKVILFGDLYGKHKDQFNNFEFYSDINILKKYFESLDLKSKNVLLKGSRSMGLERLIT